MTPVDPRMDAFEALYRDEFAFVWSTARRLGVAPAIHEDVVQDVFLTAYRRLDQLRFEVSARAWLYGVTRRVAARYRRTASRTARRMQAVAHARAAPGPAPQDRLIAVQQLERGLTRLGERTREAFVMAELLGMSGPEIAAELGLPLATVYSRVRLAREQLIRELQSADALERGLAATRADDEPAPQTAGRCWLLVLPGLSVQTGGLVGLYAAARGFLIILALAGAAAITWPSTPAAPPPAPPISAPPPAPIVPAATPAAPPAATSEPPPVAAPRRAPADRLGAEVALLDRARAALEHTPQTTLALLAEHTRGFPDGALVDLRGALEIEALCRLGRSAESDTRAAQLTAAHPRSAALRRFQNFKCTD